MEVPKNWRLQKTRYRLIGEACLCGAKLFPPRDICPECGDGMPFTRRTTNKRKELVVVVPGKRVQP